MEPIETTNYLYMREQALHLAVQHAQHRQGYLVEDVLADAEDFLNWLLYTEDEDNG